MASVVLCPQCALDTSYWTGFNHFVIWGSIVYYFSFHLAFYSDAIQYKYSGVAFKVFSQPNFWFCLLLTSTSLILPMVAARFYWSNVTPTLADRLRMKQRMKKSKSRPREFPMRRQSTFRRSTRSMRSGYAFAHQKGFGELITSGLNMRERVDRVLTPLNVVLCKMTSRGDAPPGGGTTFSTHEPKNGTHSSSPKKSPSRTASPPLKNVVSSGISAPLATPDPSPSASNVERASSYSKSLNDDNIIFVERL